MKVVVDPLEVLEPLPFEPLEPVPVDEPAGDDPAEALIKEAKQRARRRRWLYGSAVFVLAIAAVAAITLPGGPSSPHRAARAAPKPPTPLGAPLVQGPDSASTLLTSWGQTHVGYILVYADGRVLFASDVLTALPDLPWPFSGVAERHLTTLGLDVVRAGTFDPKEVVEGLGSGWLPGAPPVSRSPTSSYWRDELWIEPTAHDWEPTVYVLCPSSDSAIPGQGPGATDVVDKLPADVQPLLDGRQHLYDPIIGTGHWLPATDGPGSNDTGLDLPGRDCFRVTAAEASTLPNALGDGRIYYDGGSLYPQAIFPHGQPVIWGG